MNKLLVAMSGGVDSAAACGFLQKQGYTVSGGTLLLRDGGESEAEDARLACAQMGIDFTLLEQKDAFCEKVIRPFIETYVAGKTPNPCIFCNEAIKFGLFLDWALAHGFDGIATGHYAKIEQREDGRYLLKKSCDAQKDQTYMLCRLTQDQLAHTLFPLGDKTKADARQMAESLGLSLAHKHDSQDICFIPDGDYLAFLISRGVTPKRGNFIDEAGNVLGAHKGMEAYTIGQRRGLECACGKRVYVLGKQGCDIVLGDNEKLFTDTVEVENVNYIPFDTLKEPLRVEAKVRYSQTASPATLSPTDFGAVLKFDTPQRAVTPGQTAVFYQDDLVLGGGYIR